MRLSSMVLALAALSGTANAQPGLGERVYGATVDAGVTELEAGYGRVTGGADDGTEIVVIETSHAFTDHFSAGLVAEFEREPSEKIAIESLGLEAVLEIGRLEALGIDVALYGEYQVVRHSADEIETKLLLQRRSGPFDGRLNLIIEKELESHEPVEFGYAALVDWQLLGEVRLGFQAFGELGSTEDFLPRNEHFLGPVARVDIDHLPAVGELQIEAGYLFALGAASDSTDGQLRLLLEYEFRL